MVAVLAVADGPRRLGSGMRLRYLGYVGQNLTLGRTTGRTLRLANLSSDRLASRLEANLADLHAILDWNLEHGIHFFRLASSFVPFASHPACDLDWEARFGDELASVRARVEREALRLTMHPGQYTVLNSPDDGVVERAVAELEYCAALLERVDPASGTATLHLGGAYGDKEAAKERFVRNAGRLSRRALSRLALENDDTLFDVCDVLQVAEAVGAPVVFDLHHHRVLPPPGVPTSPPPALFERVVASWNGRVPKMHLSSAREAGTRAHADGVRAGDLRALLDAVAPVAGDAPFDLMLEAKDKDRALLALAREAWLAPPGPPREGAPSA